MDGFKQNQTNPNSQKNYAEEAGADLLDETKKFASQLYDEGVKKIEETKNDALHYSDELLDSVREQPLKAIIIAGAVGMILASFLRK